MIEEYKFGSIAIDGKKYNHDIEVRWNGDILEWWRAESHVIDLEDIQRALEQKPEIVIFGTGAYGVAKISERTKREIEKRGIQIIIDKTDQAVKTFNIILEESRQETGEQKRIIGLFHLTC